MAYSLVTRACASAVFVVAMLGATVKTFAQTKITLGIVSRSAPNWPEYVAQDMGFFKAENIAIDPVYVGSIAAIAQQTTAGSLDIGNTTFEMAITAIDAGARISIIGSTTIKYPYSLVTAKDVKSAADLKGKVVMLPVRNNDIDNFFRMWANANGLKESDVDRVYDGSSTNRYAALVAGAAAGAAVNSPLDFTAIGAGYNKLIDFGSYVKGYGFIGIISRKDWLAKNGDAARGYLRAVSKGVDWLYDPANKDKAIDILMKETKQERDVVEKTYRYYVEELKPYSTGLNVPDADFNNVLKAFVDNGTVKSKDPTKAKFVDLGFLPK
jgi:NitT/TauT family transport system substrate-binding protein